MTTDSRTIADAGTALPTLREPVKLIVWDLDETIWRGTLAEGPVALMEGRARLLNELVDRGVMVSISSKNDLAAARAHLEALELWHLFIFPRIDWGPKGPQVAGIIEAASLRPQNVLFVDDMAGNLEEAVFFSPGIQVVDPQASGFDELMAAVVAGGKDDRARTRLADYRVLEAKTEAAASYEDNFDFLRSCDIRVRLSPPAPSDASRIHELIGRTNQLNYTKRRVSREDVEQLLADPRTVALTVRVEDRFGDYGLVGFGAVREGQVEQLAFSCRILGMGVERAIYEHLGSPRIAVAEPVSAPLEGPPTDWLHISEESSGPPEAAVPAVPMRPTILVVGGCDVEAAIAFIADRERVATYMNFSPADLPHLVVHRDSIDYLLSDHLTADQRRVVLGDAPFLDPLVFDVPDWAAYEHIVYSPLIDYVQAKYVSDAVPGFYCSFGDQLAPDLTADRIAAFAERTKVDPAGLARFASRWRPVIKPDEEWRSQLDRLLDAMASAKSVTVLLGATRTFDGLDSARLETHRHANELIREVVARHPKAAVIEVDPYIRGPEDFRASIRHYDRRVYRDIAAAISARVGDIGIGPLGATTVVARARPAMPRRIVRRLRRLGSGALHRWTARRID